MSKPDNSRPLPMEEAIIPIASLIFLVALSYFLFGDLGADGPNQVALVVATMIAAFLAWRRGFSTGEMREAAIASVASGMGAIFILLAVGALIGTWALSGTLVAMVYYGLKILSPNYFYMTAAIICAVVSTSIGSSWTTVGTIGVGLMGIAHNMELSPAITAAAVISGAYLGDTTSPLSDSANLAAGATGVDLYEHIQETALTSAIALLLALAFFWTLGSPGDFDASEKIAAIEKSFHISPVLFAPIVVVVALALLRFPPFTTIFIGALAGGVLAAIVAPERVTAFAGGDGLPTWLAVLKGVWLALAGGYKSTSGFEPIDQLASRGGMASMLGTIWLVIAALAFGGVIERAGVLDRLITPIMNAARSTGAMVGSVVAAVLTTNIATADQYLAVVLPSRMFKSAFAKEGFASVVLSRTVGGAATPTSALIPWNSCGAYMAATLGVATWSYAPFAVFNIVSPIVVILFAWFGLRTPRRSPAARERSG